MAADEEQPRAVLDGVRVIELADWVAGPFATSLLSDFGAEVIRIDLPGKVVNTRMLYGLEEIDAERSPFFAIFAHDKKSVTLDVRSEAGRQLLLNLLRRSDVLVESFRPGTLERWGLGWENLREVNPGLVLLRISGYGQTGPWRDRPGLDRVAQAFGGASHLTGHPASPPVKCGLGIADYSTGLWGALGVMLCLFERERNGGTGQVIDHGLYESILPMLSEVPMMYTRHGRVFSRNGNRVSGVSPGDAFETADGRWVHVSASGEVGWRRLTEAMNRPDLFADPRFVDTLLRDQHNDVLLPIVAAWVRTMDTDTIVERLAEFGVPAGLMQSIDELMAHPQTLARENFVELPDSVFGTLTACAPMPRLSETPGRINRTGPQLGEHNREVFGDVLGLDEQQLQALARAGAI